MGEFAPQDRDRCCACIVVCQSDHGRAQVNLSGDVRHRQVLDGERQPRTRFLIYLDLKLSEDGRGPEEKCV